MPEIIPLAIFLCPKIFFKNHFQSFTNNMEDKKHENNA